ncbi:hypothetical protein NKR23_g7427 [Pleurostoma richardsiae]|uniref:Uncharacterized protein n=1 Tax=Pleurostoma richardsiae TaxID=41990 RepID=A0AA38VMV5_9PEZI|nr:hypothetical protein NKR23_g7427 [Pleurostoma richardsiae]
MGALCGKQSSDSFAQPGRPLGTAPTPAATAPVPASKKTVGGPPRTLGGSTGESADASEARRRAAEAAEARAKASDSKPVGKLGGQLKAQQKQTRVGTLKEASEREVRTREMDAAGESLNHN